MRLQVNGSQFIRAGKKGALQSSHTHQSRLALVSVLQLLPIPRLNEITVIDQEALLPLPQSLVS